MSALPADINEDAAITLEAAAASFLFPGGAMTVRTLRAERDRGRLVTWMMGKREFTSLRDLREMMKQCRDAKSRRVSPSESGKGAPQSGSSETAESEKLALELTKATAQRLKQSSRATSQKLGSSRSASVIRLKF